MHQWQRRSGLPQQSQWQLLSRPRRGHLRPPGHHFQYHQLCQAAHPLSLILIGSSTVFGAQRPRMPEQHCATAAGLGRQIPYLKNNLACYKKAQHLDSLKSVVCFRNSANKFLRTYSAKHLPWTQDTSHGLPVTCAAVVCFRYLKNNIACYKTAQHLVRSSNKSK